MGKPYKITFFQTLLLAIGALLIIITSYVAFDYFKKQSKLMPHYEKVFKKKATDFEQKIDNFFVAQEKNIANLITSPTFIEAVQSLKKENQEKKDIKTATQTLKRIINEYFIQIKASNPFKNVMIARIDGDIIFSLNQPEYIGLNLRNRPHLESDLGYSFARALMSLAPDISAFYYDEIINQPAIYINESIFTNGKREGIIIVQIDHTAIYQMTQNYLELGKTGEFVIAEKIGNKAQIIAPTRLNPHIAFKRSGLEEPGINIPIQNAINAQRGIGLGYDYRKKQIFAYWNYLPNVDWGYDIKIDHEEIITKHATTKTILIWMFILSIIFWCFALLNFSYVRAILRQRIRSIFEYISPRTLLFNATAILGFLCACSALYFYYALINSQSIALEIAKSKAHRVSTEAIKHIEHDLENISSMVKGMTTHLHEESFTKEDLIVNLKRKINEEPTLFAFCVAYKTENDEKKSFAPYATRKENKVEILQLQQILEKKVHDPSFLTQTWFKEAIEKKEGLWIQPTKELITGKWVVIYAEPFFAPNDTARENPIGVSAAFYTVDNLKRFLGTLHIGETGYPSIANKEGKFIYHPIDKYDSAKGLRSEAEQTDNLPLSKIDERILDGQSGIESYFGLITNRMMWISYQPIAMIGWSLILRFVEQEITPPVEQAHHQRIWIIVFLVLTLLFLSTALILKVTQNKVRSFAFAAPPIFILGILGIWNLVTPDIGVKNGIVIYNAIGLDAYVEELTKDAQQRHESKPLLLPTGLFVESWSIAGSNKVDITGTIWQVYNKTNHKGLAQEFNLPDATSLRILNPYKNTQNEDTTVGASFNATFAQEFDFSKFPLDSQRVKIKIDHKNLSKNILLIPDLDSYETMSPLELPGLDKEFKYYGFTIHRSFFSLEKTRETTDFGVTAYGDISEHVKLNYNIIVTRDLVNALIVYFLPLLVILISLFAIFAVTGRTGKRGAKKTFVSIASYTGLLFALVVLNIALRNQYPSGTVLYLEYFFFYTYLTILVLIVHGAFVQVESYEEIIDEKITPTMKNLFWPAQLGIWFITTVIVFYT